MPSKSSVVKSLFGFSLPTWINAAIGILAVPLVTRLFDPETLGKFNLFCTYGYILSCIALAGLNQGFMRFYHEPLDNSSSNGLFKLCTALALGFTFVVGVFVLVLGYPLSTAIVGEFRWYVPICLVVYLFSCVILNMIQSSYRMQNLLLSYGLLTILMNVCAKITYAGAIAFEDQLIGAIVLFAFSYFSIALIFGIRTASCIKHEPLFFNKQNVLPLLKYSLPLMPVLFIAQINTALPKLLISEHLDYSQVGIYAAAYSLVSIISIVQSGINVFWPPFIYNNYQKNPQYLSSGHLLITFAMTIFGLAIILFQDVIYLIIGESYRQSQAFFALLLFSPICYTISETTGVGINLSKKTYLNIINYAVTIAITFTLCFLLIPAMGLTGAAISVAIAALCMLVCKSLLGERYFQVIKNPARSFFAPLFFLLVAVLDTVFFTLFWVRTAITAIAIIIVCFVYRQQLSTVLEMGLSMLKGRR